MDRPPNAAGAPPGPAAPAASPLDTTLVLVSPENIAFEFRLAGPATRAIAFAIDLLVMAAVFALIVLTLVVMHSWAESLIGPMLVVAFFTLWGYGAACEVLNNGQTPGKAALGLRVVSQSGLSINAGQAILRNLLRGVDLVWPVLPGAWTMAATRRFQRLGDLAAGTVVVLGRARRQPPPPPLPKEARPLVETIPAGFEAGPLLAEALADYVGRRGALAPPRRRELAALAAVRLCAAWGLPPPADPDAFICAVYAKSTGRLGEKP